MQTFINCLLCGAIFVAIGISIQKRMTGELETTLHDLLPICANCKQIRFAGADPEEQNSWEPVEKYITQTAKVRLSHGICPDCMFKLYPEDASGDTTTVPKAHGD
jgi:hypothetical protein